VAIDTIAIAELKKSLTLEHILWRNISSAQLDVRARGMAIAILDSNQLVQFKTENFVHGGLRKGSRHAFNFLQPRVYFSNLR
jgi:hypothetical protein